VAVDALGQVAGGHVLVALGRLGVAVPPDLTRALAERGRHRWKTRRDRLTSVDSSLVCAALLRRESGGRFDGSAFEQVGSGQFREPGVGAGAGEVDGHLPCESCDLG
jgi:hypothetical protein